MARSGVVLQLHIYRDSKRFEPVEDRTIFAPGRAGLAGDRFDLGNGLALHFEIDLRVAIRRGWVGMPQQGGANG
jgi:hypothetical protein